MTEKATPTTPRGSLALIRDATFGRYLVARLIATSGIWIYNLVAAVLAFQISGSATVVGLVSVAQFSPQVILAPLSGAMADRGDRKLQLMVGRTLVALGAGGLSIWVAIVGAENMQSAWPIIAAAAVVGIGFVISAPSQEALLPALVRPDELPPAVALNALPPTLARAIGPAVGALVAVSVGPALAFAIAAASNVLFAILIKALTVEAREAPGPGSDRRVRAGFAYVRSDPVIALLLTGVVAVGIGADPVLTLTPSLAKDLGGTAVVVGVFATAFGVGSVAVFAVLGRVRGRLGLPGSASLGLILLAGGAMTAALVPVVPVVALSFAIAGAGMTMGITTLTTQIQMRVPDELRGRVMALWAVAFVGVRPVIATINGGLADLTSVHVALLVSAVAVIGLAWVCRPRALLREQSP